MGRRQKGKRMKRRKGWHRGRGEAARSLAAIDRLPDTGAPVDLSLSVPIDARLGGPSRLRQQAV